MSDSDGSEKLDAILSHLARGRDLHDFSGTTTEKLGVIRTAAARRLIAWNKTRARYELTLAGWRRTAPRGSLGLAPLVIGAALGAAIGAAALAILLAPTDVPLKPVEPHAMPAISRAAEANVVLASAVPADEVNGTPAAPPVPLVPSSPIEPIEPVKPVERAAPEEPAPAATAHVAKQTSARKHRHHRTSRARTRRMWAWAYRDERFARFGRIFR